jgi:prepilin-type N-terminal cleavage/methylation domain-containing protein
MLKKKYPPQPSGSTGFTLIELLVVIGIIAILAALLTPMASKALSKANMTADTNRLQQIGIAMSLYVGENNVLPNANNKISGTEAVLGAGDRWTFTEAVDRYFPADKSFNASSIYNFGRRPVWFSPSARAYSGFVSMGAGYIQKPLAFGYNPNVDNGNWAGNVFKIPNRSQTVIMGEANDAQGYRLDPAITPETKNNVRTAYRMSQLDGQALYLFCDFHVEALKGNRGYSYYSANPQEYNIWKWW